MAIEKEKTLPSGVTGNYWRIMTVTADRQNLTMICTIALFKDIVVGNTGFQPMGALKTFKFPLDIAEFSASTDILNYAYVKILAAAQVPVTKDILGNTLANPTTMDPDLAGGVMVQG